MSATMPNYPVLAAKVSSIASEIQQFRIHDANFKGFLVGAPPPTVRGASLTVSGDILAANCLGFYLTARPRPVVGSDERVRFEYPFMVEFGGTEVCVWAVYLAENGVLGRDAEVSDVHSPSYLCDYNSPRKTVDVILVELALALLKAHPLRPTAIP